MEAILMIIIVTVIFIIIQVAILRWVLRINHIVDRLDRIANILLGKEKEILPNKKDKEAPAKPQVEEISRGSITYKKCPGCFKEVFKEVPECYYCKYKFV